jgi:glucan phosphoethanolaminetransferase (alkaline phosphatase superfamily)
MNNKRKMTMADKWKYFLFRAKKDFTLYIVCISLLLIIIFSLLYITKVITAVPLVVASIVFVISFVYCFIVNFIYALVFMMNKNIVDGHIFKVHRTREYANNSDASIMATKARAISEEGNISTYWQYYPRRFSKIKNRPVIIILNKKNEGSEFYY